VLALKRGKGKIGRGIVSPQIAHSYPTKTSNFLFMKLTGYRAAKKQQRGMETKPRGLSCGGKKSGEEISPTLRSYGRVPKDRGEF